jgi:hypothetical protein
MFSLQPSRHIPTPPTSADERHRPNVRNPPDGYRRNVHGLRREGQYETFRPLSDAQEIDVMCNPELPTRRAEVLEIKTAGCPGLAQITKPTRFAILWTAAEYP